MKKSFIAFSIIIFTTLLAFGQTNSGLEGGSPYSKQYAAPQMNPLGCENILLYTDDPYNEPDFADIALQNLGCTYTGYYLGDFSGFETALTSFSWDIVIFANDNNIPPQSLQDALLAYVLAGGKLIYHSWLTYVPLETALGVTVLTNYGNPIPIYRWNPGHLLFIYPNAVPDLTDFATTFYGIDGWNVDPISQAIPLAGYTVAPATNQSAFVYGNSGRTIYQGWMDANVGDADSDGKNDQVELYENMIYSLCPSEEAPVSGWALMVVIALISLTLTFRFIRR